MQKKSLKEKFFNAAQMGLYYIVHLPVLVPELLDALKDEFNFHFKYSEFERHCHRLTFVFDRVESEAPDQHGDVHFSYYIPTEQGFRKVRDKVRERDQIDCISALNRGDIFSLDMGRFFPVNYRRIKNPVPNEFVEQHLAPPLEQ